MSDSPLPPPDLRPGEVHMEYMPVGYGLITDEEAKRGAEALARHFGFEPPNPLAPEPCENCATPVTVVKVTNRDGSVMHRTNLYEVSESDREPWHTTLLTHTLERCRATRRERENR